MNIIGLSLTTQSPVLLSHGPPAQNLTRTMEVVPGNTLRGILAYRYIDQGGKAEDAVFRRLFLSEETRFGFALINGSQTLPLSARSCKYEAGFRKDGGHGVIDLLLAHDGEKRCMQESCHRSIDYFEGFWNPSEEKRERVNKRMITRTAINPVLGSAASAQLYSQEVIEEGQVFRAIIEVPQDIAGELDALVSTPFVAVIGTGKSRGQGWVEVRKEETTFYSPRLGARQRFEQYMSFWRSPVLAVTLLSDAIFHDDYLRDCTAPTPRHLQPLGIDPREWGQNPIRAFAASRMVFGFDGAPFCLPRLPRLAVVGGSTFLFQARSNNSPTIPDGGGQGWVGDKNGEGYGHVLLWHPFHLKPEQEENHE